MMILYLGSAHFVSDGVVVFISHLKAWSNLRVYYKLEDVEMFDHEVIKMEFVKAYVTLH